MLSYAFLRKFRNTLCVTLFFYALHPFSSVSRLMVILWILGDESKKLLVPEKKKMLVPGTESDTRVPVLKDLDTGLTSSG